MITIFIEVINFTSRIANSTVKNRLPCVATKSPSLYIAVIETICLCRFVVCLNCITLLSLCSYSLSPWTFPPAESERTRKIDVDEQLEIAEKELSKNKESAITLQGDCRATLRQLIEAEQSRDVRLRKAYENMSQSLNCVAG